MKILMVKRLESSFPAFRLTLGRFIQTYERVIAEFQKGHVYISKKHIGKIFDCSKPTTRRGSTVCWKRTRQSGWTPRISRPTSLHDLESDLKTLRKVQEPGRRSPATPNGNPFGRS